MRIHHPKPPHFSIIIPRSKIIPLQRILIIQFLPRKLKSGGPLPGNLAAAGHNFAERVVIIVFFYTHLVILILRRDYPRLFRRCAVYTALAASIFLTFSLGTYASVRLRPSTAYVFVPGPLDLVDGDPGVSAEDMSERFRAIRLIQGANRSGCLRASS
jgi:hypothetical protein